MVGPSIAGFEAYKLKCSSSQASTLTGDARGTINWRNRAARRTVDLRAALLRKGWAFAAPSSHLEAANLRFKGARPNSNYLAGFGRRLHRERNQDLSKRLSAHHHT